MDNLHSQSVENGEPMNRTNIPQTDSIQELADFWDTHNLTDFEDELEEVTEPVFDTSASVQPYPRMGNLNLLLPVFDTLVSVRYEPGKLESINTQAKSLEYFLNA